MQLPRRSTQCVKWMPSGDSGHLSTGSRAEQCKRKPANTNTQARWPTFENLTRLLLLLGCSRPLPRAGPCFFVSPVIQFTCAEARQEYDPPMVNTDQHRES